MRWLIATCLTLGCIPVLAHAQDSSLATASPPSLVRSARVSFDAYYQSLPIPASGTEHMTFGDATYAPFTAEHWQVGISPSWQLIQRSDAPRNLTGSGAIIVNYVFRDGTSSRPYAGVFLEQGSSYGQFGLQAGWLYFVTPSVAMRAEAQIRNLSYNFKSDSYDLLVRFDPYLFGRANERLTSLPGFGAVDVNFAADYVVQEPGLVHTLQVSGLMAPFITRWLEAGTDGWLFYDRGEQHQIELFGRAYLPIDTRLLPFAEGFVGDATIGGPPAQGSHGARAGVRAYLTRGVALDVAFEWRNFAPESFNGFTFTAPESRLLHAALTTQFAIPHR